MRHFIQKEKLEISTRDVNKFLEFIKPCYNDALNYCRGLCRKGSRIDEAEDIFQDSLLKALENFDKLEDEGKFRNWLFTIITNTYISRYRKRLFGRLLSYDEYKDFDKLPEIFPRVEQDEMCDELFLALSKLSDKEKIAFLLFEIGGFSIEEIKILQKEISSSAIKSRLSRTREKLRKIIEDLGRNKFNGNVNRFNSIDNLELETARIINKIKP
jgi:RNA polymerase sigma-70 factor (ECF subfamily)